MSTEVQGLDVGDHAVIRMIRTKNFVFVKLADGRVRHTGRRSIDLGRGYGSNDQDRSAFCKLAGIKLADFRKEMAKSVTTRMQKERDRDLRQMRALAARFGYKVTPLKP